MKILTKQITVALAILGLLASPLFVSAVQRPVKSSSGFCSTAANVRTQLNTKLGQLETKRGQKRTEISDRLKQRHDQREVDKQTSRNQAKSKFEKNLTRIEDLATTDAQKAAVAAFKAAIEQALATRKAAVDAAMQTFRTSQSALVTQRQDAIKSATMAYKDAVATATAKAQSDCAAGIDAATVRSTFVASIKAAKDKFQSEVTALDKIGQQVKDLTKTRNDAVKAANQVFKTAMEQARDTLKAAFPEV